MKWKNIKFVLEAASYFSRQIAVQQVIAALAVVRITCCNICGHKSQTQQ